MSPDGRRIVDRALTRTALVVIDVLVLVSLAWLAWLGVTGLVFVVSLLTSSGVPT